MHTEADLDSILEESLTAWGVFNGDELSITSQGSL